MSDKKIKFEVTCYLQGYSSWCIEVYEGDWLTGKTGRVYTIDVKSGKLGSDEITNKTFMFPIESTIIESNN